MYPRSSADFGGWRGCLGWRYVEPNRNDQALERVLNLAMALDATGGMTSADILDKFYPDLDKESARQGFERDKRRLRRLGLALKVSGEGDETKTSIDQARSFIDRVNLEPSEAAAVAMALRAALGDESFPLADALRSAIMRLSQELSDDTPGSTGSRINAEQYAGVQGANMELVLEAMQDQRSLSFHYTNSDGTQSDRSMAPYGVHLLGGRWYVVGLDSQSGTVRTFTVLKMSNVSGGGASFTIPKDFDIKDSISLPFQYARYAEFAGQPPRSASLIIPAESADRAAQDSRGYGTLVPQNGGSLRWTVDYVDLDELCRFVIDRGYRFAPESTDERARLAQLLGRLEASHG